jgi:flagellar L-ring protein precursor FlgH
MKLMQQTDKRAVIAVLLLLAVYVSGCAAPVVVQSDPPVVGTPPKPDPVAQETEERSYASVQPDVSGSLWTENGSLAEMFVNAKARRIGDIVTIMIMESSKASNKASTNTGRTSGMSIGLNNMFGLEEDYPSISFNPFKKFESSYDSEFDGTGTTARSGDLSAYITARIVRILPNGNFIIQGNREVRINNENQVITLTGTVRPRDISAENVIQSTYIADARISYSGSGVIDNQQKPGWLAQILNGIWPF